MRRTCLVVLGLAALLPDPARAAWVVGVRSGYALALGELDATGRIRDVTGGQIPVQLDLGFRHKKLTLAAYGSYGFGSVAGALRDSCDAVGQSCSTTSLRIGAEVWWSFAEPQDRTDPWIGAAVGYENLTIKRFTSATYSGSEWLALQGGVDWRLDGGATMGAFASVSLGQYTRIDGGGLTGEIVDRRFHEWVTLGLRGTFVFGT